MKRSYLKVKQNITRPAGTKVKDIPFMLVEVEIVKKVRRFGKYLYTVTPKSGHKFINVTDDSIILM